MTVHDLINELNGLNPAELIECDYITASGVIIIAKEQFEADITRAEAETIICTLADGMDGSALFAITCNDIEDLLEEKEKEEFCFYDDRGDDNNESPYSQESEAGL